MIGKALRFAGWKFLGAIRGFHLQAVRLFGGERAIRLAYWISASNRFNRIFEVTNSLFPESGRPTPGNRVPVDDLREVLAPYTIGGMRLDIYAIQFLWASLLRERPSVLIECGSGISTLILASYAKKSCIEWNRPVTVLSVDQSEEFAAETEWLLREHGLESYARVFQVPLNSEHTYDLAATSLSGLLGQIGWDWLLIDGPFGPAGCRQSILRDMAIFSHENARWFLDDAFRDPELAILQRWATDSRFVVEGIVPTHAGLATGLITREDNSPDHKAVARRMDPISPRRSAILRSDSSPTGGAAVDALPGRPSDARLFSI